MRKQILYFSFTFILSIYMSISVNAQNENGNPFITNYCAEDYKGHSQNHSVIQDKRGFIYIANGNGIIVYDGNSLLYLIDDSFDIAKIEAGQLKIVNTDFYVNSCIEEFCNSFNTFDNNKKISNIELKVSIPKNKDSKIHTYEFRFRQILNNLISNALKFTKSGYIEIGYSLNNNTTDFITFFVKDTGIGIHEKELDSTFNRFSKIMKQKQMFTGEPDSDLQYQKILLNLAEVKFGLN